MRAAPKGGDHAATKDRRPAEPVSPKDVLATTFHLLGTDPATTVPDQQGRPMPIAGSGGVRPELLA